MHTDDPRRDSDLPPPEIGDRNVEQLLGQAYQPETPDSAFVQQVQEQLVNLGQELAQARPSVPGANINLAAEFQHANRRLNRALAVVAALFLIALALQYWPRSSSHQSPGPLSIAPPSGSASTKATSNSAQVGLIPRPLPAAPPAKPLGIGEEVRTLEGQQRRLMLPDSSVLYLNQQTTVKLDAERHLTLSAGEVFIEVAPRPPQADQATFVVQTPDRQVSALGTRFAVQTGQAGTGVVVTQGQVKVDGFDGLLQAGQQLAPGSHQLRAAPRFSHVLDWTQDLMAAAEAPLIPASAYRGGALVAVNSLGQAASLSLRRYHVDVHIEDGFARTTIDQTYFNHEVTRLEGTFYFPLPPDASLSRLAMYVDGHLMEGGMAERDYARNVFESIVSRQKDPALLEWVDGSTFKMRVFPLEGRQEKRIILSYTQRLPSLYGRMHYRFPAGHSLAVGDEWSFHARVKCGSDLDWHSATHGKEIKATREGADLLLDARARHVTVERDVNLDLIEKDSAGSTDVARFSSAVHEGARYLMLRHRPNLPGHAQRQRRDWVFLFESSGARNPLLARVQIEVIRALLANAEHDDTFAIVTAGTRQRLFDKEARPVTPENVKEAIDFLEHTHLIGALDLSRALTAAEPFLKAGQNPYLVHLGSAIASMGVNDLKTLLKRLPEKAHYVGVGVGKRWSRSFMKAAAEQSGGYFTQINPDEAVSWRAFELFATLNTPRLLDVKVVVNAEQAVFISETMSLAQGEELCAISRIDWEDQALPRSITISGTLDGKPFQRVVPVKDVAAKADYLPRIWAKLEIDRLLGDDADKNKGRIVALSKAMYVMTPFTSLLVLENDKMYEDYKVDRGRKDHWAMYPCPATVPVVQEPLPSDRDESRKPISEKKSVNEVLDTILVRVPPRYLIRPHRNYPLANRRVVTFREICAGAYAVPANSESDDLGFEGEERDLFPNLGWRNQAGLGALGGGLVGGGEAGPLNGPIIQERVWDRGAGLLGGGAGPLNLGVGGGGLSGFAGGLPAGALGGLSLPQGIGGIGGLPGWGMGRPPFPGPAGQAGIQDEEPNPRDDANSFLGMFGNAGMRIFDDPLALMKSREVRDKLAVPVTVEFEANTPLKDALKDLSERYNVTILVDTEAFKADLMIQEVENLPVKLPRIVGVSLGTVLRLVLAQVQGTFLVRAGYLEVTTLERLAIDQAQRGFPLARFGGIAGLGSARDLGVVFGPKTSNDFALLLGLEEGHAGAGPELPNDSTSGSRGFLTSSQRVLAVKVMAFSQAGARVVPGARLDVIHSPPVENDKRIATVILRGVRVRSVAFSESLAGPTPATLELTPHQALILAGIRNESGTLHFIQSSSCHPDFLESPAGLLGEDSRASLTYQRPVFSGDPAIFRNLLAHAPGLNTNWSDVQAVLENETGPRLTLGRIDPGARALFARAHSTAWQAVTVPSHADHPGFTITYDGTGRYAFDRLLPEGLRERVICDGKTLWHLYPELGLAAQRTASRFHKAELARLIPWVLPAPEDLAHGADLQCQDERTVAIIPHRAAHQSGSAAIGQPHLRVHLVFGSSGKLAERQLVEMPSRQIIDRELYGSDATVRLVDGAGGEVSQMRLTISPSPAPNLNPDLKDLVVETMPLRIYDMSTMESFLLDPKKAPAGATVQVPLRGEPDRHPQEVAGLFGPRFQKQNLRKLGSYVLLAASGIDLNVALRGQNVLADHPNEPLAKYLAFFTDPNRPAHAELGNLGGPVDGFVQGLAAFHDLHIRWRGGQVLAGDPLRLVAEGVRLSEQVRTRRSPWRAWVLADMLNDQTNPWMAKMSWREPYRRRLLVQIQPLLESSPDLAYAAKYEIACTFLNEGDRRQAEGSFRELFSSTLKAGDLPSIDQRFPLAFQDSRGGSRPWSELIRQAATDLMARRRPGDVIALACQCRHVGDVPLADEIFNEAFSRPSNDNQPVLLLASLEYPWRTRRFVHANELLQSLLADRKLATRPELWRLAAASAGRIGQMERCLACLDQALEIEYQNLAGAIDLQALRIDYGILLAGYQQFAQARHLLREKVSPEFKTAVLRAATRWLALETDATTACLVAARILRLMDDRDLAWDYLTTTISGRANDAEPWVELAQALRQEDDLELAQRAYQEAYEADPTNPQCLWERAVLLNHLGRGKETRDLLRQITNGTWGPNFAPLHDQARQQLRGQ